MNDTSKKVSVLGSMRQLELNESVSFPIEKLWSIKSSASNINTMRGYHSLRVSSNRIARTVTVFRIA